MLTLTLEANGVHIKGEGMTRIDFINALLQIRCLFERSEVHGDVTHETSNRKDSHEVMFTLSSPITHTGLQMLAIDIAGRTGYSVSLGGGLPLIRSIWSGFSIQIALQCGYFVGSISMRKIIGQNDISAYKSAQAIMASNKKNRKEKRRKTIMLKSPQGWVINTSKRHTRIGINCKSRDIALVLPLFALVVSIVPLAPHRCDEPWYHDYRACIARATTGDVLLAGDPVSISGHLNTDVLWKYCTQERPYPDPFGRWYLRHRLGKELDHLRPLPRRLVPLVNQLASVIGLSAPLALKDFPKEPHPRPYYVNPISFSSFDIGTHGFTFGSFLDRIVGSSTAHVPEFSHTCLGGAQKQEAVYTWCRLPLSEWEKQDLFPIALEVVRYPSATLAPQITLSVPKKLHTHQSSRIIIPGTREQKGDPIGLYSGLSYITPSI